MGTAHRIEADDGGITLPNYRRAYVPGGTVFLTLVTYRRTPILDGPDNVARLRRAIGQVMRDAPFRIPAAVVLPDHAHFLWALPRGEADYPRRVGRVKVLFTRSLPSRGVASLGVSPSRHRHRESDVWQRRFWEHTVEGEEEFEALMDYIHYNPVRHGLTSCRTSGRTRVLSMGPRRALPRRLGLLLRRQDAGLVLGPRDR